MGLANAIISGLIIWWAFGTWGFESTLLLGIVLIISAMPEEHERRERRD
jgi:hypothetical protein